MKLPNSRGYFGFYGGRFVPETLMPAVLELESAYAAAKRDPAFQQQYRTYLRHYVGRPTPLYFAERLTHHLKGAQIYLKREDLCHTGAHKINNTLGQILLAKRMGKTRIIAETGAGQHGVATATVAARFGLPCDIYMGTEDMRRQALNVFRMKLLGARVIPVHQGTKTLKDAINEALRDWITNVRTTYYILGSVLGPHPYPMMIRDFQSVIGREVVRQMRQAEKRAPDYLIACVGGGSNSMGLFYPFLQNKKVKMIGVEAGGKGMKLGQHAARFATHQVGILHGTKTYVLQNADGQIASTHSVSAGLDYPAVGPEHSYYYDVGRIEYTHVTDTEALDAFERLNQLEGITPALESAHAVAYTIQLAPKLKKSALIVVNLSGRGDKDIHLVAETKA